MKLQHVKNHRIKPSLAGTRLCRSRVSSNNKLALSGFLRIALFMLLIIAAIGIIADDITATLDSADGSSAFAFRDSGSTIMASIDSNGNVQAKGGLRLDSGGTETSEKTATNGCK